MTASFCKNLPSTRGTHIIKDKEFLREHLCHTRERRIESVSGLRKNGTHWRAFIVLGRFDILTVE